MNNMTTYKFVIRVKDRSYYPKDPNSWSFLSFYFPMNFPTFFEFSYFFMNMQIR